MERASKSAHHHVINDEAVVNLVSQSWLPPAQNAVTLPPGIVIPSLGTEPPVEHFIAIDGGYQEAVVRPEYPSSTLCFMQFGAVAFSREDLLSVDRSPHPAPEDMERLRNLERLKLAFPLRNMRLAESASSTYFVRLSIYQFFSRAVLSGSSLMETLKWFIFREFEGSGTDERVWHLASNPCTPGREGIDLHLSDMRGDFTFVCTPDKPPDLSHGRVSPSRADRRKSGSGWNSRLRHDDDRATDGRAYP